MVEFFSKLAQLNLSFLFLLVPVALSPKCFPSNSQALEFKSRAIKHFPLSFSFRVRFTSSFRRKQEDIFCSVNFLYLFLKQPTPWVIAKILIPPTSLTWNPPNLYLRDRKNKQSQQQKLPGVLPTGGSQTIMGSCQRFGSRGEAEGPPQRALCVLHPAPALQRLASPQGLCIIPHVTKPSSSILSSPRWGHPSFAVFMALSDLKGRRDVESRLAHQLWHLLAMPLALTGRVFSSTQRPANNWYLASFTQLFPWSLRLRTSVSGSWSGLVYRKKIDFD